jgi:hypothetical protein
MKKLVILSFTIFLFTLYTNAQGTNDPNALEAVVTVDGGVSKGTLLRTERYNNLPNRTAFPEQREADVKFLNEQGLHGLVYRVWVKTVSNVYNREKKTYDYAPFADLFTNASQLSDYLLVNLAAAEISAGKSNTPEESKPIVTKVIRDLKTMYPKIKYIEVFNEPDYRKDITPDTYYSYYKVFYEAVNEVNAELKPAIPILVGGPALTQFTLTWLRPFLDAYKNDPSPKKRLDFISYHGYFTKPDSVYQFFKEDPTQVKGQRKILDAELRSRGLRTDIQAFITETGLYPGPLSDDKNTMQNDVLRQAAGQASLFYWFLENGKTYPFNWVTRHYAEGRKDQLVTRDAGGKPFIQTGKFTPYGNEMLMMSKLKKNRIAATVSDTLSKGKGLYALAAKDDTGVSVMLWNYQGVNSKSYTAKINVTNLPASLRGKNVKVSIYRIDSKTSNYNADLENCNLQKVAEKMITGAGSYSCSLSFEPNSLQLIMLEPAVKSSNTQVSRK